jgi:hypothetical protein
MNQPTVTEMMQAYAADAVDYTRSRHNVDLDYSMQSVQQVERILDTLADTVPRDRLSKLLRRGPDPDQMKQLTKMFGGYIGEVFRLQWGGEWTLHSPLSSEPHIALQIRGNHIFPPDKVYKRIMNGSEDNVWMYAQMLQHALTETS